MKPSAERPRDRVGTPTCGLGWGREPGGRVDGSDLGADFTRASGPFRKWFGIRFPTLGQGGGVGSPPTPRAHPRGPSAPRPCLVLGPTGCPPAPLCGHGFVRPRSTPKKGKQKGTTHPLLSKSRLISFASLWMVVPSGWSGSALPEPVFETAFVVPFRILPRRGPTTKFPLLPRLDFSSTSTWVRVAPLPPCREGIVYGQRLGPHFRPALLLSASSGPRGRVSRSKRSLVQTPDLRCSGHVRSSVGVRERVEGGRTGRRLRTTGGSTEWYPGVRHSHPSAPDVRRPID